ncbi:MAG: GIY-YIG domain protein [Candidatus Nomurabacteria bacterium GW2011_GWA1_43_17]|nr:MAG: GIY-YIG domain protein [Candidatus Nomurabacteria bacterium GW2011_GWA1_43_17]
MFTVYVLKDGKEKLYKGVTNNLKRRLAEHHSGHTLTTSRMKSLKLVYKEEYDTFEEARKRELYLKSAAGRRFLKDKSRLSSVGRATTGAPKA